MYCKKHDAFYNEAGEWTESQCNKDEGCPYCKDRPEKHPSDCECLADK